MSKKPLILVTNDDGITAPGLRTLIEVMGTIGKVVVVAPDSPQSGMGHAITINSTLYLNTIEKTEAKEEYSCSGTPADCVKLAVNEILKCKPDLCVSGINHGSNASINVIYSGTMSAVVEAGIEGIPAVGFSLLDYNWDASFGHTTSIIKKIALNILRNNLPRDTVLNVNLPAKHIKGIKICNQAKAYWKEEFYKRTNPQGRNYYWLSGDFASNDTSEETDIWALNHDYASIVPVQFDLTSYKSIDTLKTWNFDD